MTNGEKFKEVFKISQVDEGELYAYVWLPNHDAAEISIEWWNAEYQESTTKNDLGVDCIDRKATLDAIIKRLGIKNEAYLLEAERVIYQQILAMPSVTPQEPRWILCKERLPDKTGWYLITFKVYGGGYAVCELCYRRPENYWTRDNIGKKILDNDEVVAWMPLPKAYSEVEE